MSAIVFQGPICPVKFQKLSSSIKKISLACFNYKQNQYFYIFNYFRKSPPLKGV